MAIAPSEGCCPTPDMIQSMVEGRMDPAGRSVFWAHLAGCPTCRQLVARLEADVPMEAATLLLQEGQHLGDYEVLPRLGAGGMGVVFLARHSRIHNREIERRFLNEARAANAVHDPGKRVQLAAVDEDPAVPRSTTKLSQQ